MSVSSLSFLAPISNNGSACRSRKQSSSSSVPKYQFTSMTLDEAAVEAMAFRPTRATSVPKMNAKLSLQLVKSDEGDRSTLLGHEMKLTHRNLLIDWII